MIKTRFATAGILYFPPAAVQLIFAAQMLARRASTVGGRRPISRDEPAAALW